MIGATNPKSSAAAIMETAKRKSSFRIGRSLKQFLTLAEPDMFLIKMKGEQESPTTTHTAALMHTS